MMPADLARLSRRFWPPCPRARERGSISWPEGTPIPADRAPRRHRPRKRTIQYPRAFEIPTDGGDYWIPAFAGMTTSTTLADLFTPLLFADLFSAVRASLWRRSND